MNPVYPLLKPADWPHKDLALHRPLLPGVPGAPLVTYGSDIGSHFQFVPAGEDGDLDRLDTQARRNLDALSYPWEVGEVRGLRYATSSGHEFCAERVLCRPAMLECHRLLGASRIVAAVPRRTVLLAARDGLPAFEAEVFRSMVAYTYRDDSFGNAPISPALFIVEDGIIRHIRLPAPRGAWMS